MKLLEIIVDWLPMPLQVWIVVLLFKKGLSKRFPLFLVYTIYAILDGLARAVLFSVFGIQGKWYFYVYWVTLAIEQILSAIAIYESFKAIFRDFYQFKWFRWIWPAWIAVIWLYSGSRVLVHRPLVSPDHPRLGPIIVSGATTTSFTIVVLVLLFFLLVRISLTRWHLYEFHIVYGLGVATAGMVIALIVRAEFGGKFNVLVAWVPPVTYLIAVVIWLSAFLRTEPKIVNTAPPEKLLQQVQQDLKIVQRIQKGTRAGPK